MDENDFEEAMACHMLLLAACDNSDDESMVENPKPKRTHSSWVRKWISQREDKDQNNTLFKLQRQLQQVCIHIKK